MDDITTNRNKDKPNIKPYRKYQIAILLCLLSFFIFSILLYSTNNALNYAIAQNDNLLYQLDDKKKDNDNFNFVFSSLEVNYLSLYKLDNTYIEIIRTITEFYQFQNWIVKDHRNIQLLLCYKATTHGDNSDTFHENCGGYSPLVFLFETIEGYRFGAYISVPVMQQNTFIFDEEAFIFSFDTNKHYKIIKSEVAFNDPSNAFPQFGQGDIYIINGFLNHSRSFCLFPKCYEKDLDSPGDYPLTGGLKNFRLKEMEVIKIFINSPSE